MTVLSRNIRTLLCFALSCLLVLRLLQSLSGCLLVLTSSAKWRTVNVWLSMEGGETSCSVLIEIWWILYSAFICVLSFFSLCFGCFLPFSLSLFYNYFPWLSLTSPSCGVCLCPNVLPNFSCYSCGIVEQLLNRSFIHFHSLI